LKNGTGIKLRVCGMHGLNKVPLQVGAIRAKFANFTTGSLIRISDENE